MTNNELPLGLGFALAQNPDAINHFTALPENERLAVIEKARSVTSETEMQALVNSLMK